PLARRGVPDTHGLLALVAAGQDRLAIRGERQRRHLPRVAQAPGAEPGDCPDGEGVFRLLPGRQGREPPRGETKRPCNREWAGGPNLLACEEREHDGRPRQRSSARDRHRNDPPRRELITRRFDDPTARPVTSDRPSGKRAPCAALTSSSAPRA